MNSISKIIESRILQPWQQKHFSRTSCGRQIRQLRTSYINHRCFLIGNGPSLSSADLDTLHEHGEICFAFNRIYNIFDQTSWRPDFYVSQDEKMLAGCADIVSQFKLGTKFIPIQLKWYHDIHIKDATYFNIVHQQVDDPRDFHFSDDAAKCLYNSSTVMYTAAQLAAYMGFTEIYLIGVDHQFHISQNNQGQIVVDHTVKDYFSEQYNADREKLYIPNTEKSTLTYIAMKNHCEKRGIRVYNATRGGKLEVFPRVDFDSLFTR